MTRRDWLSVVLKITGVCLALYWMYHLVNTTTVVVPRMIRLASAEYGSSVGEWTECCLWPIASALAVIVALALVKWGDVLAERLASDSSAPAQTDPVDGHRAVFFVALKIIGAWVAVRALPMIVTGAAALQRHAQLDSGRGGYLAWVIMGVIGHLLGFAIGVYLLAGGSLVARLAFGRRHRVGETPGPGEAVPGLGRMDAVFSLALRIIGAILLATRLPWVVRVAIFIFPATSEVFGKPVEWRNLFDTLVVLAVSVYFLTGAKHLVRFVFRRAAAGPEPTG